MGPFTARRSTSPRCRSARRSDGDFTFMDEADRLRSFKGSESDLWIWPQGDSRPKLTEQIAWPARVPPVSRCAAVGLMSAILVVVVALAGQWVMYRREIVHLSDLRFIGSSIAAVTTAILVFRLKLHERAQLLAAQERFQIVAAANHHVRNALQVILDSKACGLNDQKQLQDSINRVHWVLTRVLPRVHE